MASSQAPQGGTRSPSPIEKKDDNKSVVLAQPHQNPIPSNFVVPLRGRTIVILAIMASLFFIASISFSFLGADSDEPFFKATLDTVAQTNPGLVLLGENVDVDVDEPAITIRWSIIACGGKFVLPGSSGGHGSSYCGLPAFPVTFYVDSDTEAAATYDPNEIPYNKDNGQRRSIQNLVQFDSDHVLDVHEARLYPFDTYKLSSTIRAVSSYNQSLPISKIATLDVTSNFDIATTDVESYSNFANGTLESYSRDIDLGVSRPGTARFFALILFAVSWVLTHVTIGHIMIARRLFGLRALLPHLLSSGAILIAIPQLRASMPDAPGFDGVLIDSIGYFPQMVIVGISTVILLLMLVIREFDTIRHQGPTTAVTAPRSSMPFVSGAYPAHLRQPSLLSQFPRPPSLPTGHSSSTEISKWEMHRMMKHLKGQYVFPPVKPDHRLRPSTESKPYGHRRVKTMSKIMEAGEVSHWSDSEEESSPNSSPLKEHFDKLGWKKSKPKPL